MANTTRPNLSDAGVQKLEKYKANRIAEGYSGYELDDLMDKAYEYVLTNEKREKEESDRDAMDKEMTNLKLNTDDEETKQGFDKTHRFYMFKKAVTKAYKNITGNYPKDVDDYTFAKQMEDANPESAATIHDYLAGSNVTLKDVMRDLNLENSTTEFKKPESDGSIYHQITSIGREGDELTDKLADWLHADTIPAYEAKDDKELYINFGKNLANSAWNIAGDTAGMIINPIDSLNGLKNMLAGGTLYISKALHDLVKGDSTMEDFLQYYEPDRNLGTKFINTFIDPEEAVQSVDAIKDYFINRYGSVDAIANTFYEDPMGMLRDAKDVFRGFSGVAKKTAVGNKVLNAIDKYDPAAKMENAALRGVNKTIETATDTTLDDIKNIPNKTKEGLRNYAENAKDLIGQLSENEKKIIQDNPYAGEQLQKAIDTFNSKDNTMKPAQIYDNMVKDYVTNELVPELDKIIDNVSEEGRVYGAIDKLKMKANNFQSEFENALKNKKVGIDADGNLDFTKAHTINEHSDTINKIYNQLKEMSSRGEDITVSEYRDMRKLIGNEMNKAGKGTDTYNLLYNLRDALNKDAHAQLPEFSQLDDLFSKNAEKAKTLKKGLVDNQGNIKPEAVASAAKKSGKTTGLSFDEQLEEILPGHKTKMEGLNIAKNMLDKYSKGSVITQNMKNIGRAAGHGVGLLGWGGIGGIVGGYVGDELGKMLGNKLINKRNTDWGDAINNISEDGLKKLRQISTEVEKRGSMSATDKAKIDDILKNTQATKATQKAEAKATKATAKATAKAEKKAAQEQLKAQQQLEKFRRGYNKFRGINENDALAKPAISTSPFANQQFELWKGVNEQFASKYKK